MPDYIGPALRGLSRTLQTGIAGLGEQRLNRAELALKRAGIEFDIKKYEQGAPLRTLQLLKAGREARTIKEEEQPFSISDMVISQTQNLPETARFEIKKWAAKQLPNVIKTAFPGYQLENLNGKTVAYRINDAGEKDYITNLDMSLEPNQERLAGAIGSVTSRKRFLKVLAEAGDPQAKQLYEEFEKNPVQGLEYELQQKFQLRDIWQAKGYPVDNLEEGIEQTRKELEKEIARREPKTEAERYAAKKKIPLEQAIKEVAELKRAPEKLTDFERMYKQYIQIPGNEKKTRFDLRKDLEKTTGELTEGSVLKMISDQSIMGNIPEGETTQSVSAKWWNHYLNLRKQNISREDALNQTMQEMTKIALPSDITKTSQAIEWLKANYNMSEEQAKNWLRANR